MISEQDIRDYYDLQEFNGKLSRTVEDDDTLSIDDLDNVMAARGNTFEKLYSEIIEKAGK